MVEVGKVTEPYSCAIGRRHARSCAIICFSPQSTTADPPREGRMFSTTRLVERIREEYAAMPGLKLTREQACRLWGVGHETCTEALDVLLAEGFLHRTGTGKYVALPRPGRTALSVNTEQPSALRC